MSTQPEPRPLEDKSTGLRFNVQPAHQPKPPKPKMLHLKKPRPEVGPLERLLDLSA